MEWLTQVVSVQSVQSLEAWLEAWGYLLFGALFLFEIARLLLKRRLTLTLLGDSVASFFTFGFFVLVTYGLIAAAYISIFYWAHLNFAVATIPVTPASVFLLVVLCDFAYYWEHRFSHRVGLAWATHSVHHSSPYFNVSVAYRFGPMDGVWPLLFHLPLAIAGFDPFVIFVCEAFVQLYQTALHTEVVRKLPRAVEAIFNTPSHHRVHHGNNDAYIDKNYGGILIVWDRLFGTYAQEQEPVVFGLTEQINSNNPLTVYLHGFTRLLRRSFNAPGLRDGIYALVAPPEWKAGDRRKEATQWIAPVAMALLLGAWAGSTPGLADESDTLAPTKSASGVVSSSRQREPLSSRDAERETELLAAAASYYERYIVGDLDNAYDRFMPEALLNYEIDFGPGYGATKFSFRADNTEGFDESMFAGYEVQTADYEVTDVALSANGGIVSVSLRESYSWDGYNGTMSATERLHLEIYAGRAYVVRMDSKQRYR
ncbi:MAG: sterol desaturase family protein [Pseudomonadota bacterium]